MKESQKTNGKINENKIDENKIREIAHLSRISLSEDEVQKMCTQLSDAIKYFEEISEINTDTVFPLVTPTPIEMSLREDKSTNDFEAEEMLKNAPARVGNLFQAPPAV